MKKFLNNLSVYQLSNVEKAIGVLLLIFSIGFNLWIYRLEPTAQIDPNDNTFQYALVERTSQIWDFAQGKFSLLFDHWVPNWAQGYNLPVYYSHIPQILIVAGWKLFGQSLTLYTYYHWVIYLLLCFFPLSVFFALRVIGTGWLAAGIGSLLASHISTDGLYGIDPPSFLWRGYGLSSQLFAMIFLPFAIAFAWRWFTKNTSSYKEALLALLFLVATTAGHLGIGIIAFLSVGILAVSPLIFQLLNYQIVKLSFKQFSNVAIQQYTKLIIVYGGVLFLLGYWIIPAMQHNNYHNTSFWDPIWKFDSYGIPHIVSNLFDGDLFDFGRFPILTLLVGMGFFAALLSPSYFFFAVLFAGMLALYFGRTAWGGLIDLIPGMSEFHISRFIVGVHMAGLFLIPIGLDFVFKQFSNVAMQQSQLVKLLNGYIVKIALMIGLILLVYPQTIRYAAFNDELIVQANRNYEAGRLDAETLLSTLKTKLQDRPGRVFAGRGGAWGRDFRIAETPYYIYLSTFGIPTILWLPQTWSPNSDIEQYFSEDNPAHYELFNVSYVVTPLDVTPQTFWTLTQETKAWKLYEIRIPDQVGNDTARGYITGGVRPAIVASSKYDYKNVVRLWMHSSLPNEGLYPQLVIGNNLTIQQFNAITLPHFLMTDEATYVVPDGTTHSLFAEPPIYRAATELRPAILSQSNDTDMVFTASVDVPQGCVECIVVLRQTYHPNWKATVNSEPAEPFAVFPFYTAIVVPEGKQEVVFSYAL